MDLDGTPPVLETKKVLINHLKAKIQSIKSIILTEELLNEITGSLSNKEILFLLENEKELIERINQSKS